MGSGSPRSPLDEGEIGDDESKEFDDGYDENLMGDEEDKRKLAQMTEKEREQELFERSERRETLKIRFDIERKLRSKAKKRELEKRQSKQVRANKRLRASEIYSSDESSDDSDEYTPDTDKSSTLNDINSKSTSKISTRASGLLKSSSSSSASSESSSSSSSESERENDDLGADDDSQTLQDDFQMTLSDLRFLQLKRDQIEQWVYSPFFNETAIGLFVKISVATNLATKQHTYKLAQIVDIKRNENKIYALGEGRCKTDKHCQVRIGGVERTYSMNFVSNRSFDDEDYIKWKDQLHAESRNMPTREFFNRKKRDLHRAHNYVHTEKDIDDIVREKKKFQDSPYNFALKKTELMGLKADLEAQNKISEANEIQREIDALEEKARQLEKSRSSSTFSAISFVNERNRIKNIEESERVLKESKTVKTEDPFTRRKCTPTIVHNKNNNNNNGDVPSDKANDKNGQEVANGKVGSQTASSKSSSSNNNSQKPPTDSSKSVDDLFLAHANIDMELDIDI